MPGLIRGVARTAVIAGTATAVSNRVSRRQATKWSQEAAQQQYAAPPQQQYAEPQYAQPQYAEPAPAPAPAAPAASSMDDKIAQLSKLGELKTSGVLTEAEFEAEKAKILGS